MNLGLTTKRALVTAASQGIGRAVAYRLAAEGATVALSSRPGERLVAAVAGFSTDSSAVSSSCLGSVRAFPADLSDSDATERLVATVVEEFRSVDIVVVNTPGPPLLSVLETTPSHWIEAYEQLLRPAIQLGVAAGRVMKAQGTGSIVFMTSTWVKQPAAGGVLSAVFRAGVAALAKQLAIELAPFGVRVNQVMPGATETERTRTVISAKARVLGISDQEQRTRSLREIPLGRMAAPEEIADAVVFLASDASRFTTGATLQVDGGVVRSVL